MIDDEKMVQHKRGDFKIHQCYTKNSDCTETIVCKKCGGDKFIVGQDDYFTAIKCPNCEWEECIHEG